jgi:hypothetical protein
LSDQTAAIITVIKGQLRIRGLTYKDVAAYLELSEVTVKRIFTSQALSLKRISQISEMLNLSILDLAQLANSGDAQKTRKLSLRQEDILAGDPLLLVYFYLLINGWKSRQIESHYNIDQHTSIRFLAQLDNAKLIELLPNNKVNLLTSRNIIWRKNGPVRKLHESQAKGEFLDSKFDCEYEGLHFNSGELSRASCEIINRKIEKLMKDFYDLVEMDAHLPIEQKSNVGLMLATRAWVFSFVDDFTNKPS